MTIAELTSIVSPPNEPVDVPDAREIAGVESRLGLNFPPDYLELCRTYGRGSFSSDCTGVHLILPDNRYFHYLETAQIRLSPARQRSCPYLAFPHLPGLLPWAWDEGDAEVYWLVDQRPNAEWKIVTRFAERYEANAFEVFDMSCTTFLAKAFSYEINVALWNPIHFGYDETEARAIREKPVVFM